jgi:hypothetical protein
MSKDDLPRWQADYRMAYELRNNATPESRCCSLGKRPPKSYCEPSMCLTYQHIGSDEAEGDFGSDSVKRNEPVGIHRGRSGES